MTERRTPYGVFWKNPNLGIEEERVFDLTCSFFPDGEEKRVQEVWPGRWGEIHHKKGWLVGQSSLFIKDHDIFFHLVLFDGAQGVSGISRNHLKLSED